MAQICECIMLVCFGISWPISVYKSITSKSTKGKSVLFIAAILIGYTAGIIGKIVGGNVNYTLALYIINFVIVSTDFVVYFINRNRELNQTKNSTNNKEGVYNERRSSAKSQPLQHN